MRAKSFTQLALCAALMLSLDALAGNNNNAAVNQSGIGNNATVDQTAASFSNQLLSNPVFNSGDGFTVDQQGNYDNATVTQSGTLNNGQIQQINNADYSTAIVTQSGTALQGYVAQNGTQSTFGQVLQYGTSDFGNVYQANTNQVYGWVLQGYTFGPATNDTAYLSQQNATGGRYFVYNFSDGSGWYGIFTGIFQGADANDYASITQLGTTNTSALIDQSFGSGNDAQIYQVGAVGSFATIEQHGTGNFAVSNQYGTDESHILQYGNANQAYTTQFQGAPGSQNYAEIDQGNTLPSSSNNIASILQSGFSNTALITQNGNSNNASIAQAGVGNNATIHQ